MNTIDQADIPFKTRFDPNFTLEDELNSIGYGLI